MLEAEPQAEFHLSWVIRLITDHPKLAGLARACILIQACSGISRLEVVEDVGHEGVEGDPHTLSNLCILVNRQVHIPARETANATPATSVRVHTEHQPAEVAVHRCRVTESIQPHLVASATGPTRVHAVV